MESIVCASDLTRHRSTMFYMQGRSEPRLIPRCRKEQPRCVQVQTVKCFTHAAEFGGGGHPCQGLVPPQATWPSSGPADTVRPEFAANTALMYAAAANQPGATGSLQQHRLPAAAQPPTCSHPDTTCAGFCCREEMDPSSLL